MSELRKDGALTKLRNNFNSILSADDLIVGMISTGKCKISGFYSALTDGYAYNLDEKERNDLQDYFNKKLDDINKELKELGYID